MQDLAILEITECDDDLLKTYRCSKEQRIEKYLKEEAMQLSETGFVKTKVFIDIKNYKVIGYFSTNVSEVRIGKGKQDSYNKDSDEEDQLNYPPGITVTPCLTIQRFGISDDYKGKHYGGRKYSEHLMDSIKNIAAEISQMTGVLLLYVESYHGAVDFYKSCKFTRLNKVNGESISFFCPMSECRRIHLRGKRAQKPVIESVVMVDSVDQGSFVDQSSFSGI